MTATQADLKYARSDHTGALKRPEWLLELYARHGEGNASAEEVREGQKRAVKEVLDKQNAIGLPVITDGEYCRIGGFQESFGGAVSGFDAQPYVYRRRTAQPYARRHPARTRFPTSASRRGSAVPARRSTTACRPKSASSSYATSSAKSTSGPRR